MRISGIRGLRRGRAGASAGCAPRAPCPRAIDTSSLVVEYGFDDKVDTSAGSWLVCAVLGPSAVRMPCCCLAEASGPVGAWVVRQLSHACLQQQFMHDAFVLSSQMAGTVSC